MRAAGGAPGNLTAQRGRSGRRPAPRTRGRGRMRHPYASRAEARSVATGAAKTLRPRRIGDANSKTPWKAPRPTSAVFSLYANFTAQLLVLSAVRFPATFRTLRGYAPHVFGEVVKVF